MLKAAKLTTALALALGLVATACGGTTTTEDTTPDPVEPTGPQAQDIVHEYAVAELQGMRFRPEALEWPGVVPVKVKGRLPTISKQRKKVAKQAKKGKLGINDTHVLVTLLNNSAGMKEQSGVPADIEEAKKLRTEARDALKALYDQKGPGKASEVTVKRLAAIQVPLDEATAVPYYEELVQRFPQSKSLPGYQTWLAYFYLRADRDADAAKVIAGWGDVTGRQAYVLAWVKFRARDRDGTAKAIAAATTDWKGGGKVGLLRDVKLLMARSNAPVADARAALAAILPADKPLLMVLHTYQLHEGYLFSGRYDLAAEALEAAKDGANPSDKITFGWNQSDYMFRMNRPAEAAQKVKEAYDGCAAWAECPDPLKNAIAERMLLLARVYHNTYASSLDDKYKNASKVLYEMYLGITPERPDKSEVDDNKSNLEQHIANAKPEMGKHAKDAMSTILKARGEALQACYEAVLQAEPTLQGALKVSIDVQQDGSVGGVVTEPAAGKDGLAAVGGCVTEAIKTWTFPARTVPGLTRLMYPLAFAPKPAPTP